MNSKQDSRKGNIWWIAVIFLGVLLTSRCGNNPMPIAEVPTPVVSDLIMSHSPGGLLPGEEVEIWVNIDVANQNTPVAYTWIFEDGEIVRGHGTDNVTYKAPDTPDTYRICLKVAYGDWDTERTSSVVIVSPTSMPSPTPTGTPSPTNTPTSLPTPTGTSTLTPTATRVPQTALEITGIICKPNNDPVDLEGNKIFLPTRHFDKFGYDYSGFWVTVVNPQTGDQIDAQVIAFRDSHSMQAWDECDFALKKSIRETLGGDLYEIAYTDPLESRPPRTLIFNYAETSTACESFRPQLKGTADLPGEIVIETPKNCTTSLPAESAITIAGTYEGIPDDVDIWVLVCPLSLKYYPQSPNACEGEKVAQVYGKWQVPIYLGSGSGVPEWFDIVAVLADQEASLFLSDWLRQACYSGQYSGIHAYQLETMGITEKSHITVQTRD